VTIMCQVISLSKIRLNHSQDIKNISVTYVNPHSLKKGNRDVTSMTDEMGVSLESPNTFEY